MDHVPTGRGAEVVLVAPTRCSRGHELRPLNVQVFTAGGDTGVLWRCWTCGSAVTQDGAEWVDPKRGHGSLYDF
jgi:hypothetical protein